MNVEELKSKIDPMGTLTTDELVTITDDVCKGHRTTWHDSIEKSGYESLVISIYEAVNREASRKILKMIEDGK